MDASRLPKLPKFIGDLSEADAHILVRYAAGAHSILEFGVGGSTQLLAQAMPHDAAFLAVDTDPAWIARTERNLGKLGVRERCTFKTYEEWSASPLGVYDLIFVDGIDHLRRPFALDTWTRLVTGGAMLFHDTRRPGDVANALAVVQQYFPEVRDVHLNQHSSNITAIVKKTSETYVNWSHVEGKPGWRYGYDPENIPESYWSE